MMYLQVFGRTAILTTPAVSFEHLVAEQGVLFNTELDAGPLLAKFFHHLSSKAG
jgi:hypothetical protein